MKNIVPPEPQPEAALPPDIVAFCSLLARIAYRLVVEQKAQVSADPLTLATTSSEAVPVAVPEAA